MQDLLEPNSGSKCMAHMFYNSKSEKMMNEDDACPILAPSV